MAQIKIDLHVHTCERSACASLSAEEQIQAAIQAGLDAVGFADHDILWPKDLLQDLNQMYAPFRIFSGIEVSVIGGEHILVYGIDDRRLEEYAWHYPDLYDLVQEGQGFMALNHPYRFTPNIEIDYRNYPPHALEAYSNHIVPHCQKRILSLAEQFNFKVMSNSDGHHRGQIGKYYNVFEELPENEHDLAQLLRHGDFQCVSPQSKSECRAYTR
ncbi:hypothetical protein CSB45_03395 [candidate division KSB3 bacterium]|uniref:PHP domain-containing protein n=1 Tax=candidate division KSB3 bacterium TaxID=2044937 RepID=A0A2G6E9R6_9BACT|nr:MAG: hypothetical protein CSB45_03395 [candidate division KSB3 bacterium]PIE29540.1 MAG: hypothetical protein CSA57_07990 [candidate division KSB3 bacterium]